IAARLVTSLSVAAATSRAVNSPEATSHRQGKPTNCILGRTLEIGADTTVLISVVAIARTANGPACDVVGAAVPFSSFTGAGSWSSWAGRGFRNQMTIRVANKAVIWAASVLFRSSPKVPSGRMKGR